MPKDIITPSEEVEGRITQVSPETVASILNFAQLIVDGDDWGDDVITVPIS